MPAIKNILVVEDDGTYLKFWQRFLKEVGPYRIWCTKTPQEARKILSKNHIDLLISDVIFPETNGYELAIEAKKHQPSLQTILTTGYQTDLSRFKLAGLKCHLLHKPYKNLGDVGTLLTRLLKGENVFAGMDEDSFSENKEYPEITEWTL